MYKIRNKPIEVLTKLFSILTHIISPFVTLHDKIRVLKLADYNVIQFLDGKSMHRGSCCQLNNGCDFPKECLTTPRVIHHGKPISVFNSLVFGNAQETAALPFLICFAYSNIAQ